MPAIADTPAHIFLSSFLESKLHIPRLDKGNTFYVDAHRGTKDGYLFFTPAGILFGFKKPVWFVPLDLIESVSYSSITRVTFNLTIVVVAYISDEDQFSEEVEFGMIDQEHYADIDEYVRKWRLNDQSMAEEKREKRMLKSQNRDENEIGHELLKAEQEWQAITGNSDDPTETPASGPYDEEDDDDDEEDENFEVNSEDDDGGSPNGSSDDDNDDD